MPKVLCLISGGIDSPVAAYMMGKKYQLDYIFFYSEPYASIKEKEIALQCAKQVSKKLGKSGRFFIIPHGPILKEIVKNCPRKLQCVLCRRMMYRIAEKIARQQKCRALVTGDSLGQVASQTLDNLVVITKAVKISILRPLLSFDKTETTKISEEIGTYQFSKFHKCCGMIPIKPRTKARLSEVLDAEKNLDIRKLMRNTIKNKMVLVV